MPDKFNTLYSRYRRNAKRRKLSFTLLESETRILFQSNCYYCGRKPFAFYRESARHVKGVYYTGIDRKNNSEGYTKENSVACCKDCNFLKYVENEKDFLERIKRIYGKHVATKI